MNKKITLQWRLTLMTALLVTLACFLLNALVGFFATVRMDEIGDSVVNAFPTGEIGADGQEPAELSDFRIELDGQIQDTKSGFQAESIFITLVIVLGTSTVTYFTVGRALCPLKELERQTRNIQAENLSDAIQVDSNDKEIVALTSAFNGMLERLNENFATLRQFSANAAHELRTPIAVLQTQIEVLQKQENPSTEEYVQTLGTVRAQTERLSRVIDVLLEMTELRTVPLTENVSLAEITEEVFCDLTDLSQKREVTLTQSPGDCVVCGSDLLLYRAIYNLVENAIKYNRRGGHVSVEIRDEDCFATLAVSDTGMGIREEDCNRIFEPFFRVDKSRSRAMGGAGLGLALVNDIAIRHGGIVRVQSSSGEGTTLVLRLPKDSMENKNGETANATA